MDTSAVSRIAGECLRRISHCRHHAASISTESTATQDVFDVSLAIVLLLEAGYSRELFIGENKDLVLGLSEWLDQGTTAFGSASSIEPDTDVTAAVITALNLLGRHTPADRLLKTFGGPHHVETDGIHNGDRFSTDCQVLLALLQVENGVELYRAQIQQAITSICSTWWAKSHDRVKNRRNVSPFYSIMLFSKALTSYAVAHWNLRNPQPESSNDRISLMLIEALTTILHNQNKDGSWGETSDFEETSYAVLTLKYIAALGLASIFEDEISNTLDRSVDFFRRKHTDSYLPKDVWIGEAPHSSGILSGAYLLGALNQSASKGPGADRIGRGGLSSSSDKLFKLARTLPLLQGAETWEVRSCLLQGDIFSSIVRDRMPRIFPRENMRKETYLNLVPFTWAASRLLESLKLRNQELLDMMVLAVTIYQVDEFMEATVIRLDDRDMRKLDDALEDLCSERVTAEADNYTANHDMPLSGKETPHGSLLAIIGVLRQYVQFILQQPLVVSARQVLQRQLRSDIKRFFRAHLRQVKDNRLLRRKEMKTIESVHGSVFSWLRNTSADHTGGPFGMTYYLCLIEGRSSPLQPISTEALYVAQMVSQHLAALCRTYNDWGSRARDAAEYNVNSLNFEEIRTESETLNGVSGNGAFLNQQGATGSVAGHAEPEKRLLFIAEFERRCMLNSLRELKEIVNEDVYVAVKLFCDVTDIYGQIYVVKDMTPRLREEASNEVK
ncbi:hypothetical protein GGR55DRAFT_459802 [Xylaria sp. FL0064]|nr:hypothetical protein GGR55DRAFT_459802 [Xylaria sp. FL0064]